MSAVTIYARVQFRDQVLRQTDSFRGGMRITVGPQGTTFQPGGYCGLLTSLGILFPWSTLTYCLKTQVLNAEALKSQAQDNPRYSDGSPMSF